MAVCRNRKVIAADDSEILIYAAVDHENNSATLDKQTVETLLISAKSASQPKTTIYTSGVCVHGNTGDETVDENTPVKPIKLVGRGGKNGAKCTGR